MDYTNVIHKPASETLYPVEVIDFLSALQGYTNNITKTKWREIATELADVPELIDIQAKNTEIDESLSPIVAKDPGMQRVRVYGNTRCRARADRKISINIFFLSLT